MRRPQALLADEHRLVLEGLELIVKPEIDVVGTAHDGRALVELAARLHPDLVLTEVALPLLSGIDAVTRIKRRLPRTQHVFITRHVDRRYLEAALAAGASGYLTKDCTAAELRAALRDIIGGKSYITPLVTADLFASFRESARQAAPGQLTERQREVLQLLVEGHTIKEVAGILGISRKTVDYHKYNLMRTIGAQTNVELLQYAIDQGFQPRQRNG